MLQRSFAISASSAIILLFASVAESGSEKLTDEQRRERYIDNGVIRCVEETTAKLQDQKSPTVCKASTAADQELIGKFESCIAGACRVENDNRDDAAKFVMELLKKETCSITKSVTGRKHWESLLQQLKEDQKLRKKIVDIYVEFGEFNYDLETIKKMSAKPPKTCFGNIRWIPDKAVANPTGPQSQALLKDAFNDLFGQAGFILAKKDWLLGSGSFGIVFKVHRPEKPNEFFALKMARCGTLKEEFNAMSALQDLPFIPRIYGKLRISADGWWDYFVMEMVGKTIEAVQKEGLMWVKGYHQYIRLAWEQLKQLHTGKKGKCYTHGDLFARNMAVGADNPQKLYFMDFGLAKPCNADKATDPMANDYFALTTDMVQFGATISAIDGDLVTSKVRGASLEIDDPPGISASKLIDIMEVKEGVLEEFKRVGAELCQGQPLWQPVEKIAEEKAALAKKNH